MLLACHEAKDASGQYKKIEIAPILVDCVGVAPMKCMQVRNVGSKEWLLFYNSIDGFTFVPGYFYEIEVKEIENKGNIPADMSSYKWSLIKILKKNKQN